MNNNNFIDAAAPVKHSWILTRCVSLQFVLLLARRNPPKQASIEKCRKKATEAQPLLVRFLGLRLFFMTAKFTFS